MVLNSVDNFAPQMQVSRFGPKHDTIQTQQRRPNNQGHLNTITTQENETENNRTSVNTVSEANTILIDKIQRMAMIPSQVKNKKSSMFVKRMSTFASQIGNLRKS